MALPSLTTSIGSVRFMGWYGWVPSMQEIADRYRRIGQSGSGVQVLGEEDKPKEYKSWRLFTSATEAADFIGDIEDLPVDTYDMTDQWGYTFQVRISESKATLRAGKGVGTLLVECTLLLEFVGL
jgi:hypothetical protein